MEEVEVSTEMELVQHCVEEKRKYQEMLYRKYASKLFGVCLGYSNNHDYAKDVLQDAFVKVFCSLKKYKGEGSLEGWIRRIVVNTAIDHYRKASKDQQNLSIENAGNISTDFSALEGIHAKELKELIHKLPEGARIILNLYAIEGYSHKEIAQLLNISEGTSKSQLSRGKSLLQSWINKTISLQTIPQKA